MYVIYWRMSNYIGYGEVERQTERLIKLKPGKRGNNLYYGVHNQIAKGDALVIVSSEDAAIEVCKMFDALCKRQAQEKRELDRRHGAELIDMLADIREVNK